MSGVQGEVNLNRGHIWVRLPDRRRALHPALRQPTVDPVSSIRKS